MIVYATHAGGRYLPFDQSLQEQPEGKRNVYINLTNRCNCACTFCLRSMKEMPVEHSLWLKEEPAVEQVKQALDELPWVFIKEAVFCGFGEPTMRLEALLAVMHYLKETHPNIPQRLNTNGLAGLEYGRDITPEFKGYLETISISLNASSAEAYLAATRAKYGLKSYEAMLDFAVNCKAYVPNVVLTIVDTVNPAEEIERCRKICQDRGLTLRVRPYEAC